MSAQQHPLTLTDMPLQTSTHAAVCSVFFSLELDLEHNNATLHQIFYIHGCKPDSTSPVDTFAFFPACHVQRHKCAEKQETVESSKFCVSSGSVTPEDIN